MGFSHVCFANMPSCARFGVLGHKRSTGPFGPFGFSSLRLHLSLSRHRVGFTHIAFSNLPFCGSPFGRLEHTATRMFTEHSRFTLWPFRVLISLFPSCHLVNNEWDFHMFVPQTCRPALASACSDTNGPPDRLALSGSNPTLTLRLLKIRGVE